MSVHEQFADDLALYALGLLGAEERQAIEKHLQECPHCLQELARLRQAASTLALSVRGTEPPARSRERLMAAIAKEPHRTQVRSIRQRPWLIALKWTAAAAAVVIVFSLLQERANLRQRIVSLEANAAAQQRQLTEAKDLMVTLTSADAERFTLRGSKTPLPPQGKAIYVRASGTLLFLASNMPTPPPQKTYELWLIPTSGAPIPAGLFKPRPDGTATIVRPPLPPGVEAKTFAITIEPEAGSSAPTSAPIMVGFPG